MGTAAGVHVLAVVAEEEAAPLGPMIGEDGVEDIVGIAMEMIGDKNGAAHHHLLDRCIGEAEVEEDIHHRLLHHLH